MSQPDRAHYVTANDLLTGEVVFLAANGGWVGDMAEAKFFTDADEGARHLAQAEADGGRVVGPYLAEAAHAGTPVHFRERFRARGPSNYFHGKQEHTRHV